MKRILVAEGNPPELALAMRRKTGKTYWEQYEAAFAAISPEIEIEATKPYFSDFDLDALDLAAYDGFAITGSGVAWAADDERAAPYWRLLENAFAAGTPAFGSCWGLQNAAVVLGGAVGASPNGHETAFARAVAAIDHPLHKGRRESFDAICGHRDEVTRAPEAAVVTATNAHSHVQAMAYDEGEASFWGVQFHPECRLEEVAYWLTSPSVEVEQSRRMGADIARIAEDPALYADLCVKHRVGLDILDRDYHLTEIRNWVEAKIL